MKIKLFEFKIQESVYKIGYFFYLLKWNEISKIVYREIYQFAFATIHFRRKWTICAFRPQNCTASAIRRERWRRTRGRKEWNITWISPVGWLRTWWTSARSRPRRGRGSWRRRGKSTWKWMPSWTNLPSRKSRRYLPTLST